MMKKKASGGKCTPAPGYAGSHGKKSNKSMSWDAKKQGPSKVNKGFGRP